MEAQGIRESNKRRGRDTEPAYRAGAAHFYAVMPINAEFRLKNKPGRAVVAAPKHLLMTGCDPGALLNSGRADMGLGALSVDRALSGDKLRIALPWRASLGRASGRKIAWQLRFPAV
jgi:hypothetical protein